MPNDMNAVESQDLPMDQDHPLVAITQARVDQFRMHRDNTNALYAEVERYITMLKDNDFPVDFERVSQEKAAILDADGTKVLEMEIQRLRPVMLYPTDQMPQGGPGGKPMGPQPGSRRLASGASGANPLIDPDDDTGPSDPRRVPRLPGPVSREAMISGDNPLAISASNDDQQPGPDKASKGKTGMTISEIEEAAGEMPEGASLTGAGPQQVMFDPVRGMPPSPAAMEALQIRTSSNIAEQPQEIQFIYDMTNPIRSHSFFAHLADVAAYVKDLHERPAAERKGDLAPFNHDRTIGFDLPRPGS
ncbi:MAG: hypothetical protein AAF213_04635 [Pseudomonadota bacterium]